MARPAHYSDTLVGRVRRYFGIDQTKLALYLDVSKALVGHVEAGRRELSGTLFMRLLPLIRHLPAGVLARPHDEPLPDSAPAPEAAPLAARRRYCVAKATVLRFELGLLTARAVYAGRWQQALPDVLADLANPATRPDQDMAGSIADWVPTLGRAFRPAHAAQWHLLRLQAEALETEAAALAALLPPPPAG
jgi:DNA-binding XRE family transcriptional regulator